MNPLTQEAGTSQDDAGNESGAEVPNEASTLPESAPPSSGDDAGDGGTTDAASVPEASTGSEGGADAYNPCASCTSGCGALTGSAFFTCQATYDTCLANYEANCKSDGAAMCNYNWMATENTCWAVCGVEVGVCGTACSDTFNTCSTNCTALYETIAEGSSHLAPRRSFELATADMFYQLATLTT
jgi:hypothetical protein